MKVKPVAFPVLMSLMGKPWRRPAWVEGWRVGDGRMVRMAETCRKASARGVLKAMSPTAMGPPTPWWARSLAREGQGAGGGGERGDF